MYSRPHFSPISSEIGHEIDTYNNDYTPYKPNTPERNNGKDKIHNRRPVVKLISNYYQKNEKHRGVVHEDLLLHLAPFILLEE